MRRRKRSFHNSWIAIRASPDGATTRSASRGVVPGRGSPRPEKQPDPGVGANRQPAGGTEGPRLCLGLCVWCGLPIGGQSGGADHANLQYPRDEPSSLRDQQPSRRRCPCRGDLGSCYYIREVLDDNGRKVIWPIERQGTHCGPLEETKSVGELSNGGDVSVCKLDSRKRRNQAGSPPR